MNRKLIALFAAGLSCGTLFADDIVAGTAANAQTFCRITIDSGRKETVLAIPLTTADGTDALDVTKFVLTTNLKAGDKLGKKTNGNWEYWELKDDGNGGLSWDPKFTVSENGNSEESSGSITVGDCIRLTRCGAGTNLSDPFYLYGLIPTITSKSQTANAGEWTMLANPLPEATKISDLATKSGATFTDGDKIILMPKANASATEYVYDGENKKWVYYTYTSSNGFLTLTANDVASTVEIPAGEGFFFIATGSDRSFTWGTSDNN